MAGDSSRREHLTRRRFLRTGSGLALGTALGPYAASLDDDARAMGRRTPDSLPDLRRLAGEPTDELPFDHIVFVMMENHSFDNHLGMLSVRGQPRADGLRIGKDGLPTNSNPYDHGYITIARNESLCQPGDAGSQDWHDTHEQINGGKMNGFAATGRGSMIYWDEPDLPFYYSLAKTFCLANGWFCSAPCQTYPNRRFLMAGTAFGLISTDMSSIKEYPPNGTIWDRLTEHGVSWADYFVDAPTAAIIFDTCVKYPQNMKQMAEFYVDCAAGTLPSVSMVDSGVGAVETVASSIGDVKVPFYPPVHEFLNSLNQDEENPADISLGENFVSDVVHAVMASPLWPRILLVWLYDEHGGYYDHVPPPAAIAPDAIKPVLGPGDQPGGYNIYGPRVPAAVVSGYARPNAVTNVVHDHTSILATIEAKWNIPALTHRDANAATLVDFLQATPSFPEPPTLAKPSNIARSERDCTAGDPPFPVHEKTSKAVKAKLTVRFLGRHDGADGYLVGLSVSHGTLSDLVVELIDDKRIVARGRAARVGHKVHHTRLRPIGRHERIRPGRYDLRVKQGTKTLYDGRVTVPGAAMPSRH